jgi:predicted thioesterase
MFKLKASLQLIDPYTLEVTDGFTVVLEYNVRHAANICEPLSFNMIIQICVQHCS